MDGRIWVESQESKGSEFFVELPKIATSNNTHAENTDTVSAKLPAVVLIVEDEITNYILIEDYISKLTKNILYAATGREAKELFLKHKEISVVLMDIKLPDTDGYTLTKFMKEHRPNLPIIVQTAYAFAADKQKAFDAGCDEYLSKPLNFDLLMNVVRKYLP
jgi:CheY-like chemotaxis protein